MTNLDILRHLTQFVGDQHLFFATVPRGWREAWGQRPKNTLWLRCDSSLSQLLLPTATCSYMHRFDGTWTSRTLAGCQVKGLSSRVPLLGLLGVGTLLFWSGS